MKKTIFTFLIGLVILTSIFAETTQITEELNFIAYTEKISEIKKIYAELNQTFYMITIVYDCSTNKLNNHTIITFDDETKIMTIGYYMYEQYISITFSYGNFSNEEITNLAAAKQDFLTTRWINWERTTISFGDK